jgi:superfamily II DNA or RNA helicase
MAAETFITTANTFKPKIRIGLTGTLGRMDGKHVYIPDYLGGQEKIYRPQYEEGFRMTPKVTAIQTGISIPGNVTIPWNNRVNSLFSTEEYQYLLITIIQAAIKKKHKILVLASRLDILRLLHPLFQRSAIITSETSQSDRKINFDNIDIIFATTSIMKEGVSYPPLSAILLADPIKNPYMLEQIVGRIQRNYEGKQTPEIYDIIFSGPTGINQYKERLGFYMKNGYEINNIQF